MKTSNSQRRFSENREWHTEDHHHHRPSIETFELAECVIVNEPTTSQAIVEHEPKPKLNNLPKLSVSSPSPPFEQEIIL